MGHAQNEPKRKPRVTLQELITSIYKSLCAQLHKTDELPSYHPRKIITDAGSILCGLHVYQHCKTT